MFWDDADVLFFSIHRYDDGDFYPGGREGSMHAVGGGLGRGYSINIPWDTASEKHMPGDAAYDHAFEQVRQPIVSVLMTQG